MRKISLAVAAAVAAVALFAVRPALAEDAKPAAAAAGDDSQAFYALGVLLSRNLSSFNLTPAELEQVKAGLTDSVLGKAKADVDPNKLMPKIQELAKARTAASAEKEKAAGKEFLDKQAKEKGAQKTDSGMIYVETKAGTGAQPKATDRVKVHYHGTLSDGTVFDSSVDRGQPATFPLNGVIPCWTEGVQKMKVGGKAKLVCPSEIAYGDRGAPPKIKPGAALVFEVELLGIEPPPTPRPAGAPAAPGAPGAPGAPAAEAPKAK